MTQRSQSTFSALSALLCGALLLAPSAFAADTKPPREESPKAAADDAGDRTPDRPRRGGLRGEGGPGAWNRPAPEIDDLLPILTELQPERSPSILDIRKQDPELFNKIIRESMAKLIELHYLKAHDPEMYKLRIEDFKLDRAALELAHQYKAAERDNNAEKMKEVQKQLHDQIDRHFAVRQQIRERNLKRLEEKIADLRDKNETTKKNKDKLMNERMNQLLGKENAVEW